MKENIYVRVVFKVADNVILVNADLINDYAVFNVGKTHNRIYDSVKQFEEENTDIELADYEIIELGTFIYRFNTEENICNNMFAVLVRV